MTEEIISVITEGETIISEITETVETITSVIIEGKIYTIIVGSMATNSYTVDLVEGQTTDVDVGTWAATQVGYPFDGAMISLTDPNNGLYLGASIFRQKVLGNNDIYEIGNPAGSGETINGLTFTIILFNKA